MAYVDNITLEILEKCIEKGEFEFYLQPQYSISKNCIVGAEVLARWKHLGSFISPAEFIPVLEEKNLICVLDKYQVSPMYIHIETIWSKTMVKKDIVLFMKRFSSKAFIFPLKSVQFLLDEIPEQENGHCEITMSI